MNSLAQPRPIAERILDSFPSGSYALHALLQVLEIVESEEVPTAATECRVQPRMLVNPRFVEDHAETSEKLLMLVMHELHHVLLGHTRLFPRASAVDNLVFDAVINALLCRMFPEPEHTRFFTDYYDDPSFPNCLLRPPAKWSPNESKPDCPPALSDPSMSKARRVYELLYSERGASYHDLYRVPSGPNRAHSYVRFRIYEPNSAYPSTRPFQSMPICPVTASRTQPRPFAAKHHTVRHVRPVMPKSIETATGDAVACLSSS